MICVICKQYGGDPVDHLRRYGHTPVYAAAPEPAGDHTGHGHGHQH